jgi:hypothetical protein
MGKKYLFLSDKYIDEKHNVIQSEFVFGYIMLIIFTLIITLAIYVGSLRRTLIYVLIMISPLFILFVMKFRLDRLIYGLITAKPDSEFHNLINAILLLIFVISIMLLINYRSIRPVTLFIIGLIVLNKLHPIIYINRDFLYSKYITYDHIILPAIIIAFLLSVILTIDRAIKY